MEILAPAGGKEQLIAAVRAGADAVYLGGKGFNARANAQNFLDLSDAVSYCHARGVKAYITLNTLVKAGELAALNEAIEQIARAGADAVIVQDLGVLKAVREQTDLHIHASTQMSIATAEGALMLSKMGVSRIVAARELTREELRKLVDTGVPVEVFVHGAHCMSVSGQCYLSAVLGGRSGNRGQCAQPCRLNFKANGREYALSLKDLSLVDYAGELEKMGVVSLKIEGRMKGADYAAAAVDALKNGRGTDALKAVFSRSGFTQGYYLNQRDLNMFGMRTQEDVTATAAARNGMRMFYEKEGQCVPVVMRFASGTLTVTDGENTVTVHANAQEALTRATSAAEIEKSFFKTGGTIFAIRKAEIQADEKYYAASALNEARRSALQQLYVMREKTPKRKFTPKEYVSQSGEKTNKRYARFFKVSQVCGDADGVILPVDELFHTDITDRHIAELPFCFGDMEPLAEKLKILKARGLKKVFVGNIGHIEAAKGFEMTGAPSLNILNPLAIEEAKRIGLSEVMLSFEGNMAELIKMDGGILVYGKLPLMILRPCPLNDCRSCARAIEDRYGNKFELECHGDYSVLLNMLPLNIVDKHEKTAFSLYYFTTESRTECERILSGMLPEKYTRGLYYKELL